MIAIVILGMLYAILTKLVLSGDNPLAGIVLMAFLIFAALSLGYVTWRETLNEKRVKLGRSPNPELPTATTGKLLEESKFEPVRSVGRTHHYEAANQAVMFQA